MGLVALEIARALCQWLPWLAMGICLGALAGVEAWL
jgi:hypothetical protein